MPSLRTAIRRHRRAVVIAGVAVLAVAAPVAWYLGSPVFLRSSLVEPAPVVVAVADPSASTPSGGPMDSPVAPPTARSDRPSVSLAASTPSPTTFAARPVATGTFEGTDDFHFGRGTATVIEISPGRYHLRLEEFSVRNGPDLYVYLSTDPDGYADDALELGTLKATDGSFGYDLPAGSDPDRYRSAIIWCKQFSHLFAAAALEPADG